MILVAGTTGNAGRHVVSQLPGKGVAVCELARNHESAGLPGDVVRGDLSVPDTLGA